MFWRKVSQLKNDIWHFLYSSFHLSSKWTQFIREGAITVMFCMRTRMLEMVCLNLWWSSLSVRQITWWIALCGSSYEHTHSHAITKTEPKSTQCQGLQLFVAHHIRELKYHLSPARIKVLSRPHPCSTHKWATKPISATSPDVSVNSQCFPKCLNSVWLIRSDLCLFQRYSAACWNSISLCCLGLGSFAECVVVMVCIRMCCYHGEVMFSLHSNLTSHKQWCYVRKSGIYIAGVNIGQPFFIA